MRIKVKYIKNNFDKKTEDKIKELKAQGWEMYSRGLNIKLVKGLSRQKARTHDTSHD